MADRAHVSADLAATDEPAATERTFFAGLAEVHSFLTMAEDRVRRLSDVIVDEDHTRQMEEVRRCLEEAQQCVKRHSRRG